MKWISVLKDRLYRYSFYCFANSLEVCQYMKGNIHNKNLLKICYAVLSPYFLLKWGIREITDYTIGQLNISTEKEYEYKDQLSVVAIVKNEGLYIREWIEFHKIVGVTKFYIYDNESNDQLEKILASYIKSGEVVYEYFPGKSKQLDAYNNAVKKYKNNTKYMAFIDLDEYLMPSHYGEKLPEVIDSILSINKHAAGVGVTWRIFGSSGHINKPKGMVIENYMKRSVDYCWQNFHIKTVCDPRKIDRVVSPHFVKYKSGYWCINEFGRRLRAWFPLGQCFDKIKINHYFCKSREEALLKWNRGLADRNTKYDWKKFEDYDLNDIQDDSMVPYIKILKQKLER
ncbi:MAG: glycosyltransferase family 92 protein [Lachnospiraceae bacterium]|nr:glycosyltransferase family 92 protein [Lachnospiraceae bacterium]